MAAPSRQDPEHWRYRYAKKAQFDQTFKDGLMGEDTYKLSMELAGFSPREAREEFTLLRLSK